MHVPQPNAGSTVHIAVGFNLWSFADLRQTMRGLVDFADEHPQWRLIPAFVEELREGAAPMGQPIAGLIAEAKGAERERMVAQLDLPRVMIRPRALNLLLPWVGPDYEGVGRLAAEYLCHRAYRSLAYFRTERASDERHVDLMGEGFTAYAEAQGLQPMVHMAAPRGPGAGRASFAARFEALAKFLSEAATPMGLFCQSDMLAWHALEACRIAGLRVPHDVAVLGVGNDEFTCEIARPTLSSIHVNLRAVGRKAGEVMQSQLDGQSVPRRTTIGEGLEVITRQSTGSIVADDPEVAAAVQYIAAHLADHLTAPQLAEATGVSARTLHRKFLASLGRSAAEETRRQRLERAKQMIRGTDMMLADIARQTGFGQQAAMGRAIRLATGRTPAQLRREGA